MTFNAFRELYSNEPAEKKLELLIEQMDNVSSAKVKAKDAQWRNNVQDRAFWNQEAYAMKERIDWLCDEIILALAENKKGV